MSLPYMSGMLIGCDLDLYKSWWKIVKSFVKMVIACIDKQPGEGLIALYNLCILENWKNLEFSKGVFSILVLKSLINVEIWYKILFIW